MGMPKALIHLACLALAAVTIGSVEVNSEPEPMARPTRPKVFSSPEELKKYLDLVRDYYSLNGKARYGKRADQYPQQSAYEHPVNLLRMILAIGRQQRQQRQRLREEQTQPEEAPRSPALQPFDRITRYYEIIE